MIRLDDIHKIALMLELLCNVNALDFTNTRHTSRNCIMRQIYTCSDFRGCVCLCVFVCYVVTPVYKHCRVSMVGQSVVMLLRVSSFQQSQVDKKYSAQHVENVENILTYNVSVGKLKSTMFTGICCHMEAAIHRGILWLRRQLLMKIKFRGKVSVGLRCCFCGENLFFYLFL